MLTGSFAALNRFAMSTSDKNNHPNTGHEKVQAWGYWLFWIVFIAALVYGIHCYFEYRNRELDKRLEQLR
ncbi:MAG: hypothetical protein EPGJADBJ_04409 [Saprospiraceae bacterium]|nr:hypothetical protein [Saprospiraceae bacterium]